MPDRIVAEPDRLEAYAAAARTACTRVSVDGYRRAIRAYRDAEPNDLRPDMALLTPLFSGFVPDLSDRIEGTRDALLTLAAEAEAFAWALRQLDQPLDSWGRATTRDALSTSMDEWLATLIQVRVEMPYASDDRVLEVATARQAEADAEALRSLPDGWDADEAAALADQYPEIADLMAGVRQRAHAIEGYAEQLFVHELGADGVHHVLATIEGYADAAGRGFLEVDPASLRGDLLVPFAGAFAQAADHPDLVVMAREPASPVEAGHLALLLDAYPQPTEFLVPAAENLLVRGPDEYWRDDLVQPPGVQHWLFSGDEYLGWPTVAVTALGNNMEVSHAFIVVGGDDNLEALLRSKAALYDEDLYYTGAGQVLENGLHRWPSRHEDAIPQATDTFLRAVDLFGDGDVPDAMKRQFAAIVSRDLSLLAERVELGGDARQQVVDLFQEISYDEAAVQTLQPGLTAYIALETQVSVEDATRGLQDGWTEADIAGRFQSGGGSLKDLMGAMGAGFAEGDAGRAERHALFIGALSGLGDAGAGVGVALSPLSGGASAAVGSGAKALVSFGVGFVEDATTPEVDSAEDFLNAAVPEYRTVLERALYEDEDLRDHLLDLAGVEGSVSFEEFAELRTVENVVEPLATQADGALLDTLWDVYVNED